jgi:hypothetical protein
MSRGEGGVWNPPSPSLSSQDQNRVTLAISAFGLVRVQKAEMCVRGIWGKRA